MHPILRPEIPTSVVEKVAGLSNAQSLKNWSRSDLLVTAKIAPWQVLSPQDGGRNYAMLTVYEAAMRERASRQGLPTRLMRDLWSLRLQNLANEVRVKHNNQQWTELARRAIEEGRLGDFDECDPADSVCWYAVPTAPLFGGRSEPSYAYFLPGDRRELLQTAADHQYETTIVFNVSLIAKTVRDALRAVDWPRRELEPA
ncbi:MAG: hypothetical protein WBQ75_01125 [Acetobacteraceae bacterium]